MTSRWALVVPVKLLAHAKTRLSPYGDAARAELALAFADDVLVAALDCPAVARVLVVSDDVRVADALTRPGAQVVPDVPGGGLNAALAHGAALVQAADPLLAVAALASDLPALRAAELGSVLAAVQVRGFVADTEGGGTTLLAVEPGSPLAPAYGPGSAERHRASGAQELPAGAGVRRDVDTPQDLQEALALGVGARTAAVLLALPSARATTELEATVADDGGQGGSVLLDDGRRLAYAGTAVQPEVRLLRPGQRVRLRVAGEPPRVSALTLVGLPLAP